MLQHAQTVTVDSLLHLSVTAVIFNPTPGDWQTIIKPSSKQILVVLES